MDGGGQLASFPCKPFLNRPHHIQRDYLFLFSPVNIGFALNFAFLWFSDSFLFQIILRYVFCCRWPIGVFYLFPYFKQITSHRTTFAFPIFYGRNCFRSKFRVFLDFLTFLFQSILRNAIYCRWPFGVFYLFLYLEQTTSHSTGLTFFIFFNQYWFRSKFRVFLDFLTFFCCNQSLESHLL